MSIFLLWMFSYISRNLGKLQENCKFLQLIAQIIFMMYTKYAERIHNEGRILVREFVKRHSNLLAAFGDSSKTAYNTTSVYATGYGNGFTEATSYHYVKTTGGSTGSTSLTVSK